jgi:hypothetical protein
VATIFSIRAACCSRFIFASRPGAADPAKRLRLYG